MDHHGAEMPTNVVSFLDTLPAFRSLWPRLKSYNLQKLANLKLDRGPRQDDHDAAVDVRTLQDLVAFVPIARHSILERHLDDSQPTSGIEQHLGSLDISDSQNK